VTRYYKATRPDGTDFRTGTVDYAAALASGEPVTHPAPHDRDASGYAGKEITFSVKVVVPRIIVIPDAAEAQTVLDGFQSAVARRWDDLTAEEKSTFAQVQSWLRGESA
jgi:hypothetical protein